jgi:hypothetical protein
MIGFHPAGTGTTGKREDGNLAQAVLKQLDFPTTPPEDEGGAQ